MQGTQTLEMDYRIELLSRVQSPSIRTSSIQEKTKATKYPKIDGHPKEFSVILTLWLLLQLLNCWASCWSVILQLSWKRTKWWWIKPRIILMVVGFLILFVILLNALLIVPFFLESLISPPSWYFSIPIWEPMALITQIL